MKLAELSVNEFVNVLWSDAPAPGGGSASALAGSVGIGLAGMVAHLTVGKEKYKDNEEVMKEIIKESNKIKILMLELIDKDTEAFNSVTAVFKMPKDTEEEKATRKAAMQEALKLSVKVPFEVMEKSLNSLEVAEKALAGFNANAASDLGVGALNLKSSVQGAWLNVLINLSGINDDEFVKEYKQKGSEIIEKALPLADKIYNTVLNSL